MEGKKERKGWVNKEGRMNGWSIGWKDGQKEGKVCGEVKKKG
jgi:hypothetical protein